MKSTEERIQKRSTTSTDREVHVRYTGSICAITGEEETVAFDGEATLSRLLKELERRHLSKAKMRGLEALVSDLPSHSLILLGGVEASAKDGLETPLEDGDEVEIVNYTHGG